MTAPEILRNGQADKIVEVFRIVFDILVDKREQLIVLE